MNLSKNLERINKRCIERLIEDYYPNIADEEKKQS